MNIPELAERLKSPKYASDRIELLQCRIEAADALRELQAENDKLREALRQLEMAESEAVRNHVRAALEDDDE